MEVEIRVDEKGVPNGWVLYGDFTDDQSDKIQEIIEAEPDLYKIEGLIKDYLETLC